MPAIERLEADAWSRLRDVRLRALRDAPDAFWVTAEQEQGVSPPYWRDLLIAADRAWFVAVDDGTEVGLVGVGRHPDNHQHASLFAMWVAPGARGQGVGSALIDAAIGWAQARGYRRLRLWVNDANHAAARLYARHGFQRTGVTGTFPEPRDHIAAHERALPL